MNFLSTQLLSASPRLLGSLSHPHSFLRSTLSNLTGKLEKRMSSKASQEGKLLKWRIPKCKGLFMISHPSNVKWISVTVQEVLTWALSRKQASEEQASIVHSSLIGSSNLLDVGVPSICCDHH